MYHLLLSRREVIMSILPLHGRVFNPAPPCATAVWSTGQDQMRIVKQRLLEMMPQHLSVFLDVDGGCSY